jgi:hypothetical protein
MQKRLFTVLLFLILFYPCVASSAGTSRRKAVIALGQKVPAISAIEKPLIDGCGCSLRLPSDYEKENKRYLYLERFQRCCADESGW